MSKQDEVLKLTKDVWNVFLDIPTSERHSDDTDDVRRHIHAIQNILFTQKYKKELEFTTVVVSGRDLISVINKNNDNKKRF